MSARDSLLKTLVELGIIPMRTTEEIQARQVIFGGPQQVCLLEISRVKEADLLSALAKHSGLASTAPGPLPVDLAKSGMLRGEGLSLLAIARDQQTFLVSAHTPSESELKRCRQILGDELPLLITTELRFAEANAFVLGLSLEARQIPLLDRWGARLPDLAPSDDDLTSKAPEVAPNEPISNGAGDYALEVPVADADDPPDAFPSIVPSDGIATDVLPTEVTSASVITQASAPLPALPLAEQPSPAAMRPMSARKEPFFEPQGLVVETGPPPQDYEEITASSSEELTSSDPSRRPRKFYDRATAEHDLTGARTRDRVVEIISHYIACRFRYVSAFGFSGDEAKGLRASGTGAPSEVVRTLTIALDLPSCFKEARDDGTPRVVRLRASGLEGGVARDLARPAGIDVLLVPVAVRGRPVLLLWADNQGLPVDPSAVSDVQDFVPLVSQAVERVLLELKRKSRVVGATDSAPRHEAPGLLSHPPPAQPRAEKEPARGPAATDPQTPPPPPHRLFSGFPPADAPSGRRPAADVEASIGGQPLEGTPVPNGGDHEVAPVAKRPLGSRPFVPTEDGRPPSDPPSHFPVEAPRTLKGFPAMGRAPRVPQMLSPESSTIPEPVDPKASVLSRRILPLKDAAKDGDRVIGFAASGSSTSERPFSSAPPAAGETMVSRRDSILERLQAEVIPEGERPKGAEPMGAGRPSVSALVRALINGDDRALEALVRGGETAVGALIAGFPGPVVEPTHPAAKASECGPILGALVALGSKSTPFLTVRTADENATVRRWATYVLGELPGKESARAIASRLLDESVEVRRAALSAARRLRKDTLARRTLRAFIEQMIKDQSLDVLDRAAAIEALSDIREHEAIPTLLQLMEDENPQLQRSVRWALSVLTRQDFGNNLEQWRTFWQQHRDEDRVEWLIASLDHDERDIRRAAGEELRALAGDAFGFDEDQAAGERRAAQARFRTWWTDGGKARH